MSRLDDELREAFRRHDPSPAFAARVIELSARQPEPKKNGWKQTLIELLQPPKLRWVAIAVTASLLIAIAAGAYRNLHRAQYLESGETRAIVEDPYTRAPNRAVNQASVDPLPSPGPAKTSVHNAGVRVTANHRAAQRERQRELRARGEAAKEKVLFALQIVSATLKDAQRSINDDNYKSEP
jgi:hypothetical protein